MHWSVTRFSGAPSPWTPLPTSTKILLYPKMKLGNRINLQIRNCRIKSRRLQSGIVHTKTLAHIVRNLTIKLGIHLQIF